MIGMQTEEERLKEEKAKAKEDGRFHDLTSDFLWRPSHEKIKKDPEFLWTHKKTKKDG